MLRYFVFKWTAVAIDKEKKLLLDFPKPVMSKVFCGNQMHLQGFFSN